MPPTAELDRLVEVLVDRVAEEVAKRLRLPDPPAPPEMDDQAVARLAARLADHLVPALADRALLTAQQLAARLGISERTARQLIADGEIPSLRIGGARRVEAADVDAYVAARRDVGAKGLAGPVRPTPQHDPPR